MQSIYNHNDSIQMAAAINELVRQFENTGSVTLTSSVTSTVVSNPKIIPSSVVMLQPKTSAAASALATTYISSIGAGQFTIAHTSATTARTFDYVIHGV